MTKKLFTVSFLVTILILSFPQLPVGHAAETSVNVEEVLVFIRDVAKLDMAKYVARLSINSYQSYPNLQHLARTTGEYTLDATMLGGTSIVNVIFQFINTTLTSVFLSEVQEKPLFVQSASSDIHDTAKDFLQRYQAFSGDTSLEAMKAMLDVVDVTKDTTKIVGNLKLEVKVTLDSTSFRWRYTFNGADYSGIVVTFKNGAFYSFGDDRSYFKIGGTEVNVSREEAISIALKQAANFTYSYAGEEINNLTIAEEHISTALRTRTRDPMYLKHYPCWMVDLPLNDIYPGSVYFIEVFLWADTGEVISCTALGYGGNLAPQDTGDEALPFEPTAPENSTPDNSTLTPNQTENTSSPPIAMYAIVAAAAISVPIAIAAVALKRKRK